MRLAPRRLGRPIALAATALLVLGGAALAQTPGPSIDGAGEKTTRSRVPAPSVRAAAAIVYNTENGEILWESNSQDPRSIASITKIMTAVVFLEESPDLQETVTIARGDVLRASTTYLRAGFRVTKGDLLHLTLIASDNAAARALARVSDHGPESFIERMNTKAAELGLTSTSYADSTGLSNDNISSAYDMAKLLTYASGDHRLTDIMQKQSHAVGVGGRSDIVIRSTNQLVRQGAVDVVAGKTGFIRRAGYCLATLLRLPTGGPPVAVVVLGATSNAGRFREVQRLFDWVAGAAEDLLGPTALRATAN